MILGKWNSKALGTDNQFRYFALAVIVAGISLRIAVYLQCNSMYIDEANIARNIYERTYTGLFSPLNYDQYAPPLFLWTIKTFTLLFGYSEYAYRLYPLICGIFSLCLMYVILKYYAGFKGIWYAILLLALGPIYVRYCQVTKQYAPDVFIALVLVWLALKNTLESRSALKLFLIWAVVGSIAIWGSMPSVFILAGVGAYYFYAMVSGKDFSKLWFLSAAGAIWLVQFVGYYMVVLKSQTGTQGLVNYHKEFFFYLPVSWAILLKDFNLVLYFISTAGGYLGLPLVFHIICIVIAIVHLYNGQRAKLLLLIVPVLAVFFAAALHQYSLIQRVSLFSMPLVLIMIGTGIEQIMQVRFAIIRLAAVVIALICVVDFNAVKNFVHPMQEEEMKLSLAFLKEKNMKGSEIYMHNFASPAYIYYTQIHPDKDKWTSLLGASEVAWNADLDSLSKSFPPKAAMLYSWWEGQNIARQQDIIRRNVTLIDSNIVKGGRVYIYSK